MPFFQTNICPRLLLRDSQGFFLSTSKWSNSSSPMGPISLIGFIQMRKEKPLRWSSMNLERNFSLRSNDFCLPLLDLNSYTLPCTQVPQLIELSIKFTTTGPQGSNHKTPWKYTYDRMSLESRSANVLTQLTIWGSNGNEWLENLYLLHAGRPPCEIDWLKKFAGYENTFEKSKGFPRAGKQPYPLHPLLLLPLSQTLDDACINLTPSSTPSNSSS